MSDTIKTFSEDFIKEHLNSLPDAKTCEVDEIEHQVFEGFDSSAPEKPTQLTALYLVFGKNKNKDGWELRGYHY